MHFKQFAFCFLLLLSKVSNANSTVINFSDPDFKISLPNDWLIIASEDYTSSLKNIHLNDEKFKSWKLKKGFNHLLVASSSNAVFAIKHKPDGALKTLAELDIIRMLYNKLEENYSETKMVSMPENVSLGGLTGAYAEFEYLETVKGSSYKVSYEAWILDDDVNFFSISVKSDPKRSISTRKQIESIIESLQFGH